MKKVLIAVILLISACHNIDDKQQKAILLVKASYINNGTSNLANRETVTFSKLIELRNSYLNTAEGKKLDYQIKLEKDSLAWFDSLKSILIKANKFESKTFKDLSNREGATGEEWLSNMDRSVKKLTSYKGKIIGYKITYTYKVTDAFKNNIYHKAIFHLDTLITKITSVKDTVIDQADIKW